MSRILTLSIKFTFQNLILLQKYAYHNEEICLQDLWKRSLQETPEEFVSWVLEVITSLSKGMRFVTAIPRMLRVKRSLIISNKNTKNNNMYIPSVFYFNYTLFISRISFIQLSRVFLNIEL